MGKVTVTNSQTSCSTNAARRSKEKVPPRSEVSQHVQNIASLTGQTDTTKHLSRSTEGGPKKSRLETLRQRNLEKEQRERDGTAALCQELVAADKQREKLNKTLIPLKNLTQSLPKEHKKGARKKYLNEHEKLLENIDRSIEINKELENKKNITKSKYEERIKKLLVGKAFSCNEILRISIDKLKEHAINNSPLTDKSDEYHQSLERLLSRAKEQLPM